MEIFIKLECLTLVWKSNEDHFELNLSELNKVIHSKKKILTFIYPDIVWHINGSRITRTWHRIGASELWLLNENYNVQCTHTDITDVDLTHWGRVTHICINNLTTIGSDNGLSPGWRHAIIWFNAGILLIRTLGTNFSEILSKIHTFSFKRMLF